MSFLRWGSGISLPVTIFHVYRFVSGIIFNNNVGSELPSVNIVIGAEVFLCMTESVFRAGQSLSVRNVVRMV